jgi:hypothetical protein
MQQKADEKSLKILLNISTLLFLTKSIQTDCEYIKQKGLIYFPLYYSDG